MRLRLIRPQSPHVVGRRTCRRPVADDTGRGFGVGAVGELPRLRAGW